VVANRDAPRDNPARFRHESTSTDRTRPGCPPTPGSRLEVITESDHQGGDIHGGGDAAFFTAVRLLTVSSASSNPLTSPGQGH
jgi:hypothetical protein